MTQLAMSPPTAGPARRLARAALGLARARLVQFLAIGGAIFLIAPRPRDERRIEISGEELAIMQAAQTARARAPPGAARAAEGTARASEDRPPFREGGPMGR